MYTYIIEIEMFHSVGAPDSVCKLSVQILPEWEPSTDKHSDYGHYLSFTLELEPIESFLTCDLSIPLK